MIKDKDRNYSFLPAGRAYSAGVIANPGYEIVRCTLLRPVPIREGMGLIQYGLKARGLPITALCALELRCPSPLSFSGFGEFNEEYCTLLAARDLIFGDHNPIARTNVVSEAGTVSEPSIYTYSYLVPCSPTKCRRDFVISGAGELMDSVLDAGAIVRPGEISEDALREKAASVLEIMKHRLAAFSAAWPQVTSVHVYTAHRITSLLKREILNGIGSENDFKIRWYIARPPVSGVEFEMDARCVGFDSYE